jgi:hypothetical protein
MVRTCSQNGLWRSRRKNHQSKGDTDQPIPRMNESPPDLGSSTLWVTRMHPNIDYSETEEFSNLFLSKPCFGCGECSHSLMETIQSTRTRSQRKSYRYSCTVVKHVKLYGFRPTSRAGRLNMTFGLSAKNYARACNYDLSLATSRLPLHYRTEEDRGFLDSFLNEVRTRCIRHLREQLLENTQVGYTTPRRW